MPKPEQPSTDIMKESFRKETTPHDKEKKEESIHGDQRSWMNAPVDPNSPTTNVNIPPGVKPADAADPGRATPGAPPVDNRSGNKSR